MKKVKKKSAGVYNKKARFDFDFTQEIEAGMVLEGREVKSLRLGRGSLVDAFVRVSEGEAWLVNADIPGYSYADLSGYDSRRSRKLLLSKRELELLEQKVKGAKAVLVPLKIYPKGRVLKVLVGVGKGRKRYEKRDVLRRRDLEREARRDIKLASRE